MAEKEKVSMNYKEQVASVSSFNSKLLSERRLRIPFYDPSTGVFFNDGRRLYCAKERRPGVETGQIYWYPSRPYKLKPRPPPPPQPLLPPVPIAMTDVAFVPGPTNGQVAIQGTDSYVDSHLSMTATAMMGDIDDTSNSAHGGTSTRDSWAVSYSERPSVAEQQPLMAALLAESSSNGFGSEEEDFEEEQYTPRATPQRGRPVKDKEKNPLSKVCYHHRNTCF